MQDGVSKLLARVGCGMKINVSSSAFSTSGFQVADTAIVDSATTLSTIYGRFIDVWRQKDSIVQRNRLTRLLIKNAGHEGIASSPKLTIS